ncbi:MAG TPA: alpha/beta hydrolase [Anaerolineales bacterium]|nr:alpha/beta hydrolase [Anaerolineales bacterium]
MLADDGSEGVMMNIAPPRIVGVLLGALLLTACRSEGTPAAVVPEGAWAGDLVDLAPCTYETEGIEVKSECGALVVPENWGVADSRLIALPIVRIPTNDPHPADPVFYLTGGPGQSNLAWAPPDWLLRTHDVVMVGYRGVDGTVVLSCPGAEGLFAAHMGRDLIGAQVREEGGKIARECARAHQEAGVDLSGYTIPGVVEDLEAARKALGYQQIVLLSESYGTRIAQIYAYMHPDSLRRAVLIGVNTPGRFIWRPADLDRLIQRISGLCAQDAACSSRTDDFAQSMYAVNRDMPERWLFFKIDLGTVRFGSHMLSFFNAQMPLVFDAYLAAAEGDPSGLAMMNLLGRLAPTGQVVFGDQVIKAASADLERYDGLESVSLGESIMGAPLSEMMWPVVAAWPVELIPQELRQLQETDVEMLLVNGTVDFSTPPYALDEAAPYFHNAQIVLLPEFSHTQDVSSLQPEAFEHLITTYLDTGVGDASHFVYQPLSFQPVMSLAAIAKLLVAGIVIVPALIFGGVVLAVRRIRRRRPPKAPWAADRGAAGADAPAHSPADAG